MLLEYAGLMYVGIFAVLLRICNSIMFLGITQITIFALLFSRIFIWLEKKINIFLFLNKKAAAAATMMLTIIPDCRIS